MYQGKQVGGIEITSDAVEDCKARYKGRGKSRLEKTSKRLADAYEQVQAAPTDENKIEYSLALDAFNRYLESR